MTTASAIPPLRVYFPEEDLPEVLGQIEACLRNGRLAQGPRVAEFEEAFAAYTGAWHAVAVSSGTAALEAIMTALDVRGRDVLVPDNTFIATLAAVVFAGGRPVLVDVDPLTAAPSVRSIEAALTERAAGVIVVHIGGLITPALPEILRWCDARGLWLVEDAAHAHGSALDGRHAGTFGVAGAFSLFATKVMTSGEGGMVVTGDAALARQIDITRDHGKADAARNWHTVLGHNWRLSEVHAILGLAQLRRLEEFLAARARVAARYAGRLAGLDVTPLSPSGRSSWYKYLVLLRDRADKAQVRARMQERGITLPGDVYETPLHRQPAAAPWSSGEYPGAEAFARRHLPLPIYVGMTPRDVDRVVAALEESVDDA